MALTLPYQSSHNISDRHSFLTKWYRSIDPVLLTCYIMLIFIGGILIASGGAAIARKINISSTFLSAQWWFFTKHILFATLSIIIMLSISFIDVKNMRRIGIFMFIMTIPMLFLTLFIGNEIKGAQRWIFGIQPSEFVKPSLIIFNAWLMSLPRNTLPISGILLSLISLGLTAFLLLLQPDLGQTILICATWIIMFFIAGGHILWFTAIGGISIIGAITAYNSFSHVKMRIDSFLNPDAFDKYGINYQYNTAKSAFKSGGFIGRGPGEGEIKQILPDAHTDYIFAVAGEEFGVIFCWIIISLYTLSVIRCLWRIFKTHDKFTLIAGTGLISIFGLQAFINLSVNLGLFPPKGMTLPFISYGGSSAIALGFLSGFLLCLCRKRPYNY